MRWLLLISILMLGACANEHDVTLPTSWVRVDRQPTNSELLNIDILYCKDEMQDLNEQTVGKVEKSAMVRDFVSCMRDRGYVQVKS
jgi:hypothetical protein